MRLLMCLAVLLAAAPAWAQRTELALLAGYTTSGDIEMKALTIKELEMAGSFTWGVAISHLFTPRLGAEASWSRQGSGLVVGTSSGRAELFDVSMNQLHGSFVYQFGGEGGSLRPFASVGLGATFFGADGLESETKLAWALGAGLKWFRSARLGARLQARYNPTHLNDGSSDFCDPFGFCQDWLQQFEILGGLVVRF